MSLPLIHPLKPSPSPFVSVVSFPLTTQPTFPFAHIWKDQHVPQAAPLTILHLHHDKELPPTHLNLCCCNLLHLHHHLSLFHQHLFLFPPYPSPLPHSLPPPHQITPLSDWLLKQRNTFNSLYFVQCFQFLAPNRSALEHFVRKI